MTGENDRPLPVVNGALSFVMLQVTVESETLGPLTVSVHGALAFLQVFPLLMEGTGLARTIDWEYDAYWGSAPGRFAGGIDTVRVTTLSAFTAVAGTVSGGIVPIATV